MSSKKETLVELVELVEDEKAEEDEEEEEEEREDKQKLFALAHFNNELAAMIDVIFI